MLEPFLELPLGLAGPEDQQRVGVPQLDDDLIVVVLEMLPEARLVRLFAPALLRAVRRRVPSAARIVIVRPDLGFYGHGRDGGSHQRAATPEYRGSGVTRGIPGAAEFAAIPAI